MDLRLAAMDVAAARHVLAADDYSDRDVKDVKEVTLVAPGTRSNKKTLRVTFRNGKSVTFLDQPSSRRKAIELAVKGANKGMAASAKPRFASIELSISTTPEWDFGNLYFEVKEQFSGKPAERLESALRVGTQELEGAFKGLLREYPDAGLRRERDIGVNSMDRTHIVLSLQFHKNKGAEVDL